MNKIFRNFAYMQHAPVYMRLGDNKNEKD